MSAENGLWNCAVYGTVYSRQPVGAERGRSGLVTFSSSAIGNCTGFSGSSCGEDSQVPGIDSTSTSGQLASWNSGRGFADRSSTG